MERQRTKLIVIGEHTLGYIQPGSDYTGILHASILKGATITNSPAMTSVITAGQTVRLATAKDFDEFRVVFTGYDNKKEYEFAE